MFLPSARDEPLVGRRHRSTSRAQLATRRPAARQSLHKKLVVISFGSHKICGTGLGLLRRGSCIESCRLPPSLSLYPSSPPDRLTRSRAPASCAGGASTRRTPCCRETAWSHDTDRQA